MAIITPLFYGFRNLKSLKSQASFQLIFNFLLSFSFFYLRYTPYVCSLMPSTELNSCQLDWRECEVAMILLIAISIKNRNSISWEQSTRRALMYSKIVSGYLFFRMQVQVGLVYLIFCGLRIKFFNEDTEKYSKMTEHIVHFTDQTLEETLKSDHKVVWIIEAFANWSHVCSEVAPVFSDLASDYGHEFLRFGKIDVGKYDKWSKDNFINNGMMSKQLPTILTFQAGKPTTRRPEVRNKKLVPFSMSYEDIEKTFQLKSLFTQAKLKKGKAKLPDFVPKYSDQKGVVKLDDGEKKKDK